MLHFNSRQELADYCVKKIVEQGGRCMADNGVSCAYADAEGNHCAVGWVLPHDNAALMGYKGTLSDMVDDSELIAGALPSYIHENLELMQAIQGFHDSRCKLHRAGELQDIRDLHNIKTDAPHWQQWVDMGEV